MILILDINYKKDSLSKLEYILPVQKIVHESELEYEIKHFSEINDITNIKNYTKIIICGTAIKDNIFLKEDFNYLKEYKKPILGICAGAQILAKIYGSKIVKIKKIGLIDIKAKKSEIIDKNELKVYAIHQNSFNKNNNMEIIAETEKCIYGFKIKDEKKWGLLFHPEVRNKKIILNFLNC